MQILIKISNNAICNINSDHANNGNIDQPGGSGYVLRNSHILGYSVQKSSKHCYAYIYHKILRPESCYLEVSCLFVTRSAKRGLIAFLNFQLQSVVTHNVLSLLT